MNKSPTKSLIDIIVDGVLNHINMIILYNLLDTLDSIERNYKLGLYKNKCNYYIDCNEVKFQIKTIKAEIKEANYE